MPAWMTDLGVWMLDMTSWLYTGKYLSDMDMPPSRPCPWRERHAAELAARQSQQTPDPDAGARGDS